MADESLESHESNLLQRDAFFGKPAADHRPELVVALISALGASVDGVVEDFKTAFQSVGYSMETVRVSALIHELHREVHGQQEPRDSRASQLMDEGNAFRAAVKHGSAAAALAIAEVRANRKRITQSALVERPGIATLIRSVKHPGEIAMLRNVYGGRLLVVGVSASYTDRFHALTERLRQDDPGRLTEWYASEVTRLLERDQTEQDVFGQHLRDAFTLADVFLWVKEGESTTVDVRRFVDLWFGKPFETPTKDEQAMFHAFAAQFRSAASGRQVGACLIDEEGELIVTGTNEVPKAGGGQYWPDDSPDYRDYAFKHDANDRQKYLIVQDLLEKLKSDGWLSASQSKSELAELTSAALDGPLAKSRVKDLIEFGRIAHAEMAAICTAARRGSPIKEATLFTTTYPCHECARLIIASGIKRVVYVDPYPKSQVPEMYRKQVSDVEVGHESRVVPFVPFAGVAPRLFPIVFAMSQRHKDRTGTFTHWTPRPRVTTETVALSQTVFYEATVAEEVLKRLTAAGWTSNKS
jgi:deoxycytidylate deaminase